MKCGRPVAPPRPRMSPGRSTSCPRGRVTRSASRSRSCRDRTPRPWPGRCVEDGLTRVRVDGQLVDLAADGLPAPGHGGSPRRRRHRRPARPRQADAPGRRLDSIETAFARGLGRCRVIAGDDVAARSSAAGDAASAAPITSSPSPTSSATTAPLGACPRCEGTGRGLAAGPSGLPGMSSAIAAAARGARGPGRQGLNIAELSALTIGEARGRIASWADAAWARSGRADRQAGPAQARLPRPDRARLPDARPPGADALRRRAPPRDDGQDAGLGAGQHALRPRRADRSACTRTTSAG